MTTTTTTTPVRVIIIVIISGDCCCCSFQSCSLSSISHDFLLVFCSLDLPKGRRRVVVTVKHLSCSSSIKAGQLGRRRRVEEKLLLLLLMLVQGVQVVGVLGRLEVTS